MSALELISSLRAQGVMLQANGDRLHVDAPKGVITAELRDILAASKSEIIALLCSPVVESETVSPCPHCRKPLLVYSHPEEDSIWVQCPSGQEGLFKVLRLAEDEATPALCSDCGRTPALITGRCPECIQRLMLCPDDPCSICGGLRYWRHKASASQPAGFKWYCAQCEPPPGRNVAWYEIGG